ncbi:MAG: hypothetical protein ABSG59_22880 [Verrucomicrobiota bacterium]|jgi:hypothetical protein
MMKIFILSLIASIGGAMVARGLWLEDQGEKNQFQDINDFRLSKDRAHRGLRWVFWGVVLETVLGFGVAMWEGAQFFKTEEQSKVVSEKLSGVESRLQQRQLSTLQASIIKKRLEHFAGNNVQIVFDESVWEPFAYSMDFCRLFESAGLHPRLLQLTEAKKTMPFLSPPLTASEIELVLPNPHLHPGFTKKDFDKAPFVEAVIEAFQEAKINATTRFLNLPTNTFVLIIGHKNL